MALSMTDIAVLSLIFAPAAWAWAPKEHPTFQSRAGLIAGTLASQVEPPVDVYLQGHYFCAAADGQLALARAAAGARLERDAARVQMITGVENGQKSVGAATL